MQLTHHAVPDPYTHHSGVTVYHLHLRLLLFGGGLLYTTYFNSKTAVLVCNLSCFFLFCCLIFQSSLVPPSMPFPLGYCIRQFIHCALELAYCFVLLMHFTLQLGHPLRQLLTTGRNIGVLAIHRKVNNVLWHGGSLLNGSMGTGCWSGHLPLVP